MASPIASWNPSFAPFFKQRRLVLVGALVKVVSQFVMDGDEIFAANLDAHLHPQIVFVVDVPCAGVAHDVAIRAAS